VINPTAVKFKLSNQSIDFFELKQSYFPAPFKVIKPAISLNSGQYFSLANNSQYFFNPAKETTALNFQVGQGKTTLCYNLIEEYYKKGYVVIVCSPFIKLIEKDYDEITRRVAPKPSVSSKGIKGTPKVVFNYLDVAKKDNFQEYLSDTAAVLYSIHIMTINCLLGNSGDNELEQSFFKRNYIQNLLDITKNKKVVLFFDEIHEAVHNFNSLLIPNLLKWKGRIEKIFIASATYTPATIPVIKAAALLTDNNIQILESQRVKNLPQNQANIHLHVADFPYKNGHNYSKLICSEIKKYQTNNTPINIITGTVALAKKILDQKLFTVKIDSISKIRKSYSPTTVNVLTGEKNITYQQGQNNIGTTFKTGVNLINANDVLFVILPFIGYNNYGIFSDGISAIIQSIGRLRNGGELHIFMNAPEFLAGQQNDYDTFFNALPVQSHLLVNNSYDEVNKQYVKNINAIKDEIVLMESNLSIATTNNIVPEKERFGVWYPNLTEYYLKSSSSVILKHDNCSFGRLLSPYILWACIHDQFINATLRNITHYSIPVPKHNINKNSAYKVFADIAKKHIAQNNSISFRDAVNNIDAYLGHDNDGNGNNIAVKFVDEAGKEYTISEIIRRNATYSEQAINALYKCCNGNDFPFGKDDKIGYLNACISEAQKNIRPNARNVIEEYAKLGEINSRFQKLYEQELIDFGSDKYFPVNRKDEILDDGFIAEAIQIIENVQQQDTVLKSAAFRILQNTSYTSVFNFFQNLSFDKPTSRQVKVKNKLCYQVKPKESKTQDISQLL
jgi:hypothetical protein